MYIFMYIFMCIFMYMFMYMFMHIFMYILVCEIAHVLFGTWDMTMCNSGVTHMRRSHASRHVSRVNICGGLMSHVSTYMEESCHVNICGGVMSRVNICGGVMSHVLTNVEESCLTFQHIGRSHVMSTYLEESYHVNICVGVMSHVSTSKPYSHGWHDSLPHIRFHACPHFCSWSAADSPLGCTLGCTPRLHVQNMTHLYVWHDSLPHAQFARMSMSWPSAYTSSAARVGHDAFTRVPSLLLTWATWLIHMRDMTRCPTHVRAHFNIYIFCWFTPRLLVWNMADLHVLHDSLPHAQFARISISSSSAHTSLAACVEHDSFRCVTWPIQMFTCVALLIPMCDMTYCHTHSSRACPCLDLLRAYLLGSSCGTWPIHIFIFVAQLIWIFKRVKQLIYVYKCVTRHIYIFTCVTWLIVTREVRACVQVLMCCSYLLGCSCGTWLTYTHSNVRHDSFTYSSYATRTRLIYKKISRVTREFTYKGGKK